jgi:hypothetical protein
MPGSGAQCPCRHVVLSLLELCGGVSLNLTGLPQPVNRKRSQFPMKWYEHAAVIFIIRFSGSRKLLKPKH